MNKYEHYTVLWLMLNENNKKHQQQQAETCKILKFITSFDQDQKTVQIE